MQENGRVIFLGKIRRGIGARSGNEWVSQDFVIETNERYPRKLHYTMFGEQYISNVNLREGEVIDVIGFAESHEYNGNWYTELRCTDILTNGRSRFTQQSIPFPS